MEFETMDRLLEYLYLLVPHSVNRDKILSEVFTNEMLVPIDAILYQLKQEGYIFTPVRVDNNIAYDMHDSYSLTHVGMQFFNTSSIEGKPFKAREVAQLAKQQKQERQTKSENFIKRRWMVMPLVGFALGIIATLSGEFFKRRIWPDAKSNMQVIIVHDTVKVASASVTQR